MKTHAKSLWMVGLFLGAALWAQAVVTRFSSPRDAQPLTRAAQAEADSADALVARWGADYAEHDLDTRTPIHLGFARAFSRHFTKASGTAELNFRTGQVTVAVAHLDPLPSGSAYEVWLVTQVEGPGNTARVDLGPAGDKILSLGALSAEGSLLTSVGAAMLAGFPVDMAVVMRVARDAEPEYVIGGMQSIRFQIGREAISPRSDVAKSALGILEVGVLAAEPPQSGGKKLAALIAQGRDLFFNGTFGGNGRTCGTCHQATRDLTIDLDFIASLPATDPLFVAESNPNLPDFDPANPTTPAFEDAGPAGLMRTRALTLENINGFDVDGAGLLLFPPVFRATPALFNLEFTAPYGLSDCCPDLQNFSAGAVIQHFTKTLNRVAGVDFVLPTAAELRALEAFQLSNRSPANGNFKISGRNSLLSTAADKGATNTTRPEIRGRDLFLTVGCTTCHTGTVLSGAVTNVNTGIEALEGTLANRTPTVDIGDGLGLFQIPQLFGLRKQHFFHTGLVGNNTVVIAGETPRFANLRQAVGFYVSASFAGSPEGQFFPAILALTAANLDDIAHFLEKISGG